MKNEEKGIVNPEMMRVRRLRRPGTGALRIFCVKSILGMAVLLGAQVGMAQDAAPGTSPLVIELPKDYQVVQRDSKALGSVVVAGSIHMKGNVPPDALEVCWSGPPTQRQPANDWRKVDFDVRNGAFREAFTVRTGGWYRFEVRFSQGGQWVGTNVVEHVAVGEVFIIAGQSNSANYGEQKNQTVTGLVSAFDGKGWQLAADPEPGAGGKKGSFMPIFGDAMVNQFQVPVGLVPMGIGSTSVREWLPAGIVFTNPPMILRNVVTNAPGQWEATGKIFTNFCARMKSLGPRGFRAVLWHQGESDARQSKPECTLPGALYHDYLKTLIEDSRREIGWEAPWFVAQVSYHNPGDMASPDIRAAQRALWDEGVAREGPDTDTLTGAMREKNGLGIHLSAAGLQAHAQLWAAKVGPWLQQQIQ